MAKEINHKIDMWLKDAGYEYQCFISYPNVGDVIITKCVEKLKDDIQNGLKPLQIHAPEVFLDKKDVNSGEEWEKSMPDALCRSLVLVAVCAPAYFDPRHKWCGIEWNTMKELTLKRLPSSNFHGIIPIIFREPENLPDSVKSLQCHHNMSRLFTSGTNYFRTNEYRIIIKEIVSMVEDIAIKLYENQVQADCEQFQFAAESAFCDYHAQPQPMPFRK